MKQLLLSASLIALTMTAPAKEQGRISVTMTADTAEIRITGNISQWSNSATEVEEKINDLQAKGIKSATLYIRSWGGDVFQASEIINVLKKSGMITEVEIGAWAASAATLIAVSFPKVKMAKNGWFMVHKPSTDIQGNEDDVERQLSILKTLTAQFADVYAAKTGKDAKYITAKWASDWWMTADQAKAEGFVDELIGDEQLSTEDISAMKAQGLIKPIAATIKAVPTPHKPTLYMNEKEFVAMAISLGLSTDADVSAVMLALNAMREKASKYDALVAQQAQAKLHEKTTAVKAILDKGVADKKITAKQHANLTTMATSETVTVEMIQEMVNESSASPNISAGLKPGEGPAPKFKSWEEVQQAGPAAQKAFATEDPEGIKALYKAAYQAEMSEATLKSLQNIEV